MVAKLNMVKPRKKKRIFCFYSFYNCENLVTDIVGRNFLALQVVSMQESTEIYEQLL